MTKYSEHSDHTMRLIGVTGMQRGGGATHMAIAIANYLANVSGKKTALLDFGDRDDYRQAGIILKASESGAGFRYGNIDFYPNTDESILNRLENGMYDCMVLDMGFEEHFFELLPACQVRIAVGKLNEWNCNGYVQQADLIKKSLGNVQIKFFTFSYNRRALRLCCKALGENIEVLPYEPDPFCIHGNMMELLQRILF